MLPLFDTTSSNLLAALAHAREWLTILLERDLLMSLDATLFDGTRRWEALRCLDVAGCPAWRPCHAGEERLEPSFFLMVEVSLREELEMRELLCVLHLLSPLNLFTVLDIELVNGQLLPCERPLCVSYREDQDAESELSWPWPL